MNHTDIIVDNLSDLCDMTTCTNRLLDRCRSKGVFTRDEHTTLEKLPEGYERTREFYKRLEIKDALLFGRVLEIMAETETKQSSGLLHILKQAVVTDSRLTAPKFVEQNDVHWISAYLIDDGEAVQKQEGLYGQLGLKLGGLYDLIQKSRITGTPSYTFFTGCLSKWISMSEKSTTTFQKLDEALRQIDLVKVADLIRKDVRSHGEPMPGPLPTPHSVQRLTNDFERLRP